MNAPSSAPETSFHTDDLLVTRRAPMMLLFSPIGERKKAATERLRRMFALRAQLECAGAVRPLELRREADGVTLVCADPGGVLLSEIARRAPLPPELVLVIGLAIARALARFHAAGLVHCDLHPGNVWVSIDSGEAWLAGTGLAMRVARGQPQADPPEIVLGTLAYMAPEQTGRLNRAIDARSDLYALGVILYELSTSRRPFSGASAAELLHAHVAREPVPPLQLQADLPALLSRLIEKLLAKSADVRYQSADGLAADLQRGLEALRANGVIDAFPLGRGDRAPRPLAPARLVGRDAELRQLQSVFERVATTGDVELALVRGWSGIGKSSLVQALRPSARSRGLFCSGKFDARRSDVPYATLIDSLTELVHRVLCQPEPELATWLDAILGSVGPNVAVVSTLIPDVELIVGPQPPPLETSAKDAQLRLHHALAAFIGVFARPERPLTVFLDDLQWLDAATLDLVEYLVTRSEVRHLLLIGAYRDNEVDASHPLRRSVIRMLAADAPVSEIELRPLGLPEIAELLAETLQESPASLRSLAELVFAKTDGNPFFALQLVTSLAEERLLTHSAETGTWTWSLDEIRARRLTDDVATLVTRRISRLSPPARALLERLACLDASADASTLSLLCDATSAEIAAALEEAAAAGLVDVTSSGSRFAHDRVSEAAYALVPPERREAAHLEVARKLHRRCGADVSDHALFTIASQYNRALRLLDTVEERVAVAELDLAAARRARAATAYASALAYARAGRHLLHQDDGQRDTPLAFALGLLQAECRLLTGDVTAARDELALMARAARGSIELAAVTCLQIDLYTLIDRSDLGVEVALRYLASVGVEWTAHPSRSSLDEEYGRFHRALVAEGVESFAQLAQMNEPTVQGTMDVLTRMQVPAMFSDENLGGMVLARMANLSLVHGNGHGSCFAYAWLAGFAGAHLGDGDTARKLVTLAVRLVERPELGRYRARVLCLFGYLVTPWIDPLHAGRDRLIAAHEAARADGDVTFMSYTSNHLVTIGLGAGTPLEEVEAQIASGSELTRKAQFGLVNDFFTGQLRLVRALRGFSPTFVSCGGDETEEAFEARMKRDPLRAIAACWYWIRKLQAQYHLGDLDGAEASAEHASTLLWTSTADFEMAEYHFFAALTLAALARSGAWGRAATRLAAARRHHERVKVWARECPQTFAQREALLRAELARAEGSLEEALRSYDEAVRLAREGAYPHDTGLALELSAGLREEVGDAPSAAEYRRRAAEMYRRWGASALVGRNDRAPAPPEANVDALAAAAWSVEQMDLATVIAVAQSVASEIELDRLLQTVVRAAAEHAGAQRVVLLLTEGEELRVVAETVASSADTRIETGSRSLAEAKVPGPILRYVVRTRQPVNLADAAQRAFFQTELAPAHARSVLCLPLLARSALIGILYLEHGSVTNAFTPKRLPIVRLLASQAAAAIENARLYAALKVENAERRRAEEVLAGEKEILHLIAEDRPLADVMTALCELARHLEPRWSIEVLLHEAGRDSGPVVARSGPWTASDPTWTSPIVSATGTSVGSFTFSSPPELRDGAPRRMLVEVLTQLASFAVEHARKRDELLGSEERFRQFADALPEVVWITELDPERVVYCSPSFERIWGYTVAELYAQPRLWTDTIHPEDRARVAEKFGRWIHGIEARYEDVEFRIVRPDGQIRWIRDIGVVSKNRHGVPYRVGGIASDVTAQKLAEEAQQRAQAELAHLNRVATMGELTASIAHEVSQPLSAIVTSAGAGARWLRATPPDVEQAKETFARIARDGSRATDVITRLRALFQKTDLTREAFAVMDVVRDVEAFVCSDLRRRRIALRVDRTSSVIALGSRVQIQQVLLNLVLNAMEAIEARGGADPEITVSTSSVGDAFVEVAVRDTGVGLDPAAATRAFEAFYTTKPRGMGMGLSVARSIVEAHGGRMRASTNEDVGATFAFTLPLAAAPE